MPDKLCIADKLKCFFYYDSDHLNAQLVLSKRSIRFTFSSEGQITIITRIIYRIQFKLQCSEIMFLLPLYCSVTLGVFHVSSRVIQSFTKWFICCFPYKSGLLFLVYCLLFLLSLNQTFDFVITQSFVVLCFQSWYDQVYPLLSTVLPPCSWGLAFGEANKAFVYIAIYICYKELFNCLERLNAFLSIYFWFLPFVMYYGECIYCEFTVISVFLSD